MNTFEKERLVGYVIGAVNRGFDTYGQIKADVFDQMKRDFPPLTEAKFKAVIRRAKSSWTPSVIPSRRALKIQYKKLNLKGKRYSVLVQG